MVPGVPPQRTARLEEVLEILRREDPHARVVMVTKSEEDRTMTEAIGRRVEVAPAQRQRVSDRIMGKVRAAAIPSARGGRVEGGRHLGTGQRQAPDFAPLLDDALPARQSAGVGVEDRQGRHEQDGGGQGSENTT